MASEATTVRSWAEAVRIYTRPSVVRMLFFGFSAGLPFLLVFTTLTAWLRDYDISRSAIGFFAWIGTTYSIKVLWAPVVDRVRLPGLTRRLGQRRSWMLLAQIDPTDSLTAIALLALVVAFGSATQDITLDAFRIESDADEYQAALASTYVIGYRLAILMAGAGALYIADYWNWTVAYLSMAACMSVGMLAVLLSREPSSADRLDIERDPLVQAYRGRTSATGWRQEAGAWIVGSIVAPFKDFLHRYGWLAFPLLALIGLYKVSDLSMAAMANPLYLDLGFTLSEIATVTKVFGIVMTLTGGVIGGIVVARYGILPMMLAGALLVAITNLVFAWLASVGYSIPALFVTIGADNFATGFSATVFIAFLSSLVSRRYTATQYALFSSFMTLPGKIIGGPSGVVVDSVGYVHFFFYASALGIPAILLILWLIGRKAMSPSTEQ